METKKEVLIECLEINDKSKEILKKAGYKTVGDLVSVKKEEVEMLFNIPKISSLDFYGFTEFKRLKALLHHDFKLTFLGEYDDFGLTPEIANTPVSQLELPVAIKNVLEKQLYVYTLGDLLTVEYSSILKARHFGEKYLGILKDYVHSLGYTLNGEEPTLNEILKSLKEKGVQLLEEVIPNVKIYNPLYKNGIYTIEDLLNYGPDVCKIVRFGPLRQQELLKRMRELNLSFNDLSGVTVPKINQTVEVPKPVVAIRPNEAIITQAKIENDTIRNRIKQKEELVKEYECLMEERNQLIARENELDRLIEFKINEMKEGTSHGRK